MLCDFVQFSNHSGYTYETQRMLLFLSVRVLEYSGESGVLGAVLTSLMLAGMRMETTELILWRDLLKNSFRTV
jgi:hypothetical protein